MAILKKEMPCVASSNKLALDSEVNVLIEHALFDLLTKCSSRRGLGSSELFNAYKSEFHIQLKDMTGQKDKNLDTCFS